MIDRSPQERGNAAFYIVVISLGIAAILLVEREWVFERVDTFSAELAARSPAGAQNQAAQDGLALRLSNPQATLMRVDGVRMLVATGFITNLTDTVQPVPHVKLLLVDQDTPSFTKHRPRRAAIRSTPTPVFHIELRYRRPLNPRSD